MAPCKLERGQAAIHEGVRFPFHPRPVRRYGLIVALIAVAIIGPVTALGTNLNTSLTAAGSAIASH